MLLVLVYPFIPDVISQNSNPNCSFHQHSLSLVVLELGLSSPRSAQLLRFCPWNQRVGPPGGKPNPTLASTFSFSLSPRSWPRSFSLLDFQGNHRCFSHLSWSFSETGLICITQCVRPSCEKFMHFEFQNVNC